MRPEVAQPKQVDTIRIALGLSRTKPLFSLFGGGLDIALVRSIIVDILQRGLACTIVIVAGRSTKLLASIADLVATEHVTLVPYGAIDFVDDVLVASDLVISKAGGLITSEVRSTGTFHAVYVLSS